MLTPRIETLSPKRLIGKRLTMSLTQNRTADLWRSFMPHRNEIRNKVGTNLYSLQVYDPGYFEKFNPENTFVKWAAMEVEDFSSVPADMETFELPGGLYAVFDYKGDASQAAPFFQLIFGRWLPNSEYQLDNRPHFEILGEKYKNGDPNSEEEIWIPVRSKI